MRLRRSVPPELGVDSLEDLRDVSTADLKELGFRHEAHTKPGTAFLHERAGRTLVPV
eukprot:COSAG06_NODE_918_length_11551_cov_4.681802_19_plen_57_part_00